MSEPVDVDILDVSEHIEEQSIQHIVNLAHQGYADAAYWRGKCDGLEVTLGYLKHRLDKIEGLFIDLASQDKEMIA